MIKGPSIELSLKDRDRLFNKYIFASIIKEGVNIPAVTDILLHWCWENRQISLNFASLIILQMTDSKR